MRPEKKGGKNEAREERRQKQGQRGQVAKMRPEKKGGKNEAREEKRC